MSGHLPSYPLFNLGIFLLLCVLYVYPIYSKRGLVYRQWFSKKINFIFFFVAVSLYCVFAFTTGDFYNYFLPFKIILLTHKSNHFEDVYVWLINNCTNNYIIWRLLVWGTATMVTLFAFRRMRIQSMPAYASFTLFYLTTLSIMRGNLGTGIMALGLSYLFFPARRYKKFNWVLGLSLIMVSYFFHKSMLLSLALLIPALFPLTKRGIKLSLYLFPLAVVVMRIVLIYLGDNGLEGADETVSEGARYYSKVEMFEFNALGIVKNIVIYAAPYLILIYAYKIDLMPRLPKGIRFFFNYWYAWVYLASVCAFQDMGGWYYSRFMYMSNLPLAIFMGYVFQHTNNSKFLKAIIFTAMVGVLYALTYVYYYRTIR